MRLDRAADLRLAALAENSAGRPAAAARTLRSALRLLPDAPDPELDVRRVQLACRLTLAISELALGGLPAAERRLDEAWAFAADEPELVARWRAQRGSVLGRCGEFGTAAAELAVVAEQPQWFTDIERSNLLLNRGMACFGLGRAGEAAAEFAAAGDLARRAGDDRLAFMAAHNQGYARYLTGDLPGALAAMAAAEESSADVFRGPSLYDLAVVLHEAGLVDEAVLTLDQARAACRGRQDRMLQASVDMERAKALRLAGEFADAEASARAARTAFRRLGATGPAAMSDLIVADCQLSQRRRLGTVVRRARADEDAAAAIGDIETRARSVVVAAEAAARNGQADLARSALARYPRAELGLVMALRHRYAIAVTAIASGRSPSRALRSAAALLATSQAASASLDSRAARKVLGTRLAELDVGVALPHGPTRVLEALERWSSAGLPVVSAPVDPRQAELVEQLRAVSRSLRDDPRAQDVRRAEAARLQRELGRLALADRQEQAAGSTRTLPAPDLRRMRDELLAERDLVRYFAHDGHLWGVGFVGGRGHLRPLADLVECQERTGRLRADLRAAAHRPAAGLAELVTGSLNHGLSWLDENLLRPWGLGRRPVTVIGTHALGSLPWGMLPGLRGVPVAAARSVAEAARAGRAGSGGVRVLTGPGLEHAEAEAAAVAAAYGGRASVTSRATASDLRRALAEAGVVHVAAHGRHNAANPLFSSLRLADGEVVAHELPSAAVRADQVVLSACEVGTAKLRPGDEPLGLASTLLALGVRCVVAAVAPVDDARTAGLMTAYHAGLAHGLPADEALAAAEPDGSVFVVHGAAAPVRGQGVRTSAPVADAQMSPRGD